MRILSFIFLFLFSSLAWADSSGATSSSLFTVPNMDQSVLFLSEIFGQVGNIIGGATNGPLQSAIILFNNVALTLGGFVILYAIVVSTVNTAHDGELLGKKWSSVWIPIRMAAGFGLLLPAKVGGYAICQVIIMWLVVQGVGAADYIWGMYLKNVETGNATSQTPYVSQAVMGSIASIFNSAACSAAAPAAAAQNQYTGSSSTTLPGIFYPAPDGSSGSNNILFGFTNSAQPAECGKITLNTVTPPGSIPVGQQTTFNGYGSLTDAMSAQRQIMQNQVIINTTKLLQQAAVYYVQKTNYCNNNTDSSCINEVQRQILNAANNYSNQYAQATSGSDLSALRQIQMQGVPQHLPTIAVNKGQVAVFADLNQGSQYGWLYAGSYYILLSKLTTQITPNVPAVAVITPAKTLPSTYLSSMPATYISQLTQVCVAGVNSTTGVNRMRQNSYTSGTGGQNLVVPCLPQNLNVGGPAKTLTLAQISASGSNGAQIIGPVNNMMQDSFNGFTSAVLNASTNPVMALAAFGQYGLSATAGTFLILSGVVSLAGGVAGLDPMMFNASTEISWESFLTFITLPIFGLFGLMMGFYAMVGYYLPLVPYILFTAGALAWFALVIEAMIAGPIMSLGIVHPEGGHDIWGHSSTGMMMLISVFLRPTLMIIGFIAASLLVYVAFQMLNGGYAVAIGFLGASYFGFAAFAFCLITYGALAVFLMHQCFKLVHQLPDKVLGWIGGQAQSTGQESDAQVSRGSDKASGGGETIGEGAGGKLKKGIESRQQAKQNARELKKALDNQDKEKESKGGSIGTE